MLYFFRVCLKDPGWSGFSLSRLSSPMCFHRSPVIISLLTDFLTTFSPQFLIIVMQVVIALVVVFFIFNIPCDGPVLLFILLCLLQGDKYDDKKPQRSMIQRLISGVVGMSYGFFLSTVCDTTADAMKMAISSFFPVLMVTPNTCKQFLFNIVDLSEINILSFLTFDPGVWSDLAAGGDALFVASTGCLVLATDREYAGL